MSQALYRKYRSKSLSEVVGQSHITDILQRALTSGRIAHAYLLTGPRGVGKTSIARILAHEINQLPYNEESNHLDIIEIDAASNNGVEDVRDLREKVRLAPISADKKVYIIDEVHMLSKPAFNALLKTLEEPPEHIVFILATTDANKLPETITSRTQQYKFRLIHTDDVTKHLASIAKKENINIDSDALQRIAERGGGSFRDSISLLDQAANLADAAETITAAHIESALGLASEETINTLVTAIEKEDFSRIVSTLEATQEQGIGASILADQLISSIQRNIVKKPHLLTLLDSLTLVQGSSRPDVKLLSVIGGHIHTHTEQKAPKTVALAAPVLEVSASIEELSKKPAPVKKKKEEPAKKEASTPVQIAEPQAPDSFDWNTVITYVQEKYVALYSVLAKCGHELNGDTLTLYTGNTFYKKKLDDPKYSAHLHESLQSSGGYSLNIETIPTQAPLKDSQAAGVADIMGGGVEVSIDAL